MSILLYSAGFLLECFHYFGVTAHSLWFREHFKMSEVEIGLAFSLALWLRPAWALLGAWASRKVPLSALLSLSALIEGLSLLGLALGENSFHGTIGLILVNLGLSIWYPGLYAAVYPLTPNRADVQSRITMLNFASYAGSTLGAILGGWIGMKDRSLVYVIAAVMFGITALILASVLRYPASLDGRRESKAAQTFDWTVLTSRPVLLLALLSLVYWASYSQFSVYFPLYLKDWLGREGWVGYAFALVTAAVAAFSYLMSRRAAVGHRAAVPILAALSFAWIWIAILPGMGSSAVLLATLAFSEAFFVFYFVEAWTEAVPGNVHFAQSLNFVFSAAGMGAGSLLGGWVYQQPGLNRGPYALGFENAFLLLIAALPFVAMQGRKIPAAAPASGNA